MRAFDLMLRRFLQPIYCCARIWRVHSACFFIAHEADMTTKMGNLAEQLEHEDAAPSGIEVRHNSGIFPVGNRVDSIPPGISLAGHELAALGSSPLGAIGEVAIETEESVTREQRRSRRKRDVRARTISVKRMTKRELELGRIMYPDMDGEGRPKTREQCVGGQRPCPYVSCKQHLFLDVSARTGAIKLNFPDLEVWDMQETCALDVSDRGGTTLEEVGAIMNLTRERIRQVEVKGLAKLQALKDMDSLRDYIDEGPVGKRRLPVINKPEVDEDEEAEDADDFEADADNDEVEAATA
jgi:hypothetical protein